MDLENFLLQLSENGVGAVTSEEAIEAGEGWPQVLREWDAAQRLELACAAPDLSLPAAEWAAHRLYRGCQALVCREMGAGDLRRLIGEAWSAPRTPAVEYSVDLLFRFLPDLIVLARRVAGNDPLVAELLALGGAWPLSSVGVEGVGEVDPASILAHPGLRQLYVDRILATGDTARLGHPAVQRAVRSALGAFAELAPRIAAALPLPS
ncbi:MAG: hypothetical protein QOE70_1734 [Chthoniobacter sp.]|jgi:hypothetical protein|nr:hypothetical protein [Chthoniobacter sp.]